MANAYPPSFPVWIFTPGYTQSVPNLWWGNGWWIKVVCNSASYCPHSVTATVLAWVVHGHGLLGVPALAQVTHGHGPSQVVPSSLEHHHKLFHKLVSVQMEPSVMWNTTAQSSQQKEWRWTPHHSSPLLVLNACSKRGWDLECASFNRWSTVAGRVKRVPRLQMQRGWTVFSMFQLHCGQETGSRRKGLWPPVPVVQRLQFVLSVKT